MLAKLDARPDVIAGGAYQVFPDLSPRKFYHTFTFRRDFWIVPPKFRNFLNSLIRQTQYNDPEQVDYIAAAFLMVRREGFEKNKADLMKSFSCTVKILNGDIDSENWANY
ncbi:MAG: hypothetical protein U5M51_00455 [Emticicia sp.]|nr:hypothetical protein [Emticicia sp.]